MFIDKCIQKFLNKMFNQTPQIATAFKQELIIILPYLGKISQIFKFKLTKPISKNIKPRKLRIIFQKVIHLKTTFASKILFLKHYGQVLFIHFRAEAAQPRTLVRPMDISK